MHPRVSVLLPEIQKNQDTAWIVEQVLQSFAQGISMSAKDAPLDRQFHEFASAGLSTGERQKREKYETTRPYTDQETLTLLHEALEKVFIELPAIQVVGLRELQKLGSRATHVEFSPPDESEQGRYEHKLDFGLLDLQRELKERFDTFAKDLMQ